MQEWQASKAKQDAQLDIISSGVGNLRNLAQDMNAELDKQDMLVDEIETNVRFLVNVSRISHIQREYESMILLSKLH